MWKPKPSDSSDLSESSWWPQYSCGGQDDQDDLGNYMETRLSSGETENSLLSYLTRLICCGVTANCFDLKIIIHKFFVAAVNMETQYDLVNFHLKGVAGSFRLPFKVIFLLIISQYVTSCHYGFRWSVLELAGSFTVSSIFTSLLSSEFSEFTEFLAFNCTCLTPDVINESDILRVG